MRKANYAVRGNSTRKKYESGSTCLDVIRVSRHHGTNRLRLTSVRKHRYSMDGVGFDGVVRYKLCRGI